MHRKDARLVALRISATSLGKLVEEIGDRVAELRAKAKANTPSPREVSTLANAEAQLDFARERLSIALARLEHAKSQPPKRKE
jgi:hypothetical protein